MATQARNRPRGVLLGLLIAAAMLESTGRPADADAPPANAPAPETAPVPALPAITPPRLRFTDGAVSFWRPGADDWVTAQVNTPLAAGDDLYAADGANAEVEVAGQSFIRAGSDCELGLESVDPDFLQVKVTSGHLAF